MPWAGFTAIAGTSIPPTSTCAAPGYITFDYDGLKQMKFCFFCCRRIACRNSISHLILVGGKGTRPSVVHHSERRDTVGMRQVNNLSNQCRWGCCWHSRGGCMCYACAVLCIAVLCMYCVLSGPLSAAIAQIMRHAKPDRVNIDASGPGHPAQLLVGNNVCIMPGAARWAAVIWKDYVLVPHVLIYQLSEQTPLVAAVVFSSCLLLHAMGTDCMHVCLPVYTRFACE